MSYDGVHHTIEKLFARRGAHDLFCDIPTYSMKVMEFGRFYDLKN